MPDTVPVQLSVEQFKLVRDELHKRYLFVKQYPLDDDGCLADRLLDVCKVFDKLYDIYVP